MTPDRYHRAAALFNEARERSPAERQTFLEQACAGDTELIAEVLSLLASAEGHDEVLDSTSVDAHPDTLILPTSQGDLPQTLVANRFRLEDLLGTGGMGSVYRAFDTELRRPVALKVMRPELLADATARARFTNEAQATARLHHPNIVVVYDYGIDPAAGAFIAMEYLDGVPLRDELRRRGRLEPGEAVALAREIGSALGAAHDAGVVHRDLKPENVFLESEGGRRRAVVVDFGIARVLDSEARLTATNQVFGTPLYMSPEQCRGGTVDARSDLYTLGVILFELVTGRTPFRADTAVAYLYAHVNEAAAAPSTIVDGIPPALDTVVLRALAKSPDARFQSADELERALASVVAPAPADAPTTLPIPVTPLIGRDREVDEIVAAVRAHRMVTVTGVAGSGKSRLAVAAAARVKDDFPGGTFYVNLGQVTERGSAESAIVAGIAPALGRSVNSVDDLAATLRPLRALLVLDDCERARDTCAALATSLLGTCPELRVLAASRRPLGVRGEAIYDAALLPLPDAAAVLDVDSVLANDACRLFVERARLAASRFTLTSENASDVVAICRRLEGNPLAIVLAASRARLLSVPEILARLDDRFALLERDSSAPQKGRGLRAAFDWTFDDLTGGECRMLAALAEIEGGWAVADAEAAAERAGLGAASGLGLLASLVDHSLVLVDETGGGRRYRMLDMIREYARLRNRESQ
jgi:predicted ATPase/tRNA A-37 threonylcarbamoyl transferase component Bud32